MADERNAMWWLPGNIKRYPPQMPIVDSPMIWAGVGDGGKMCLPVRPCWYQYHVRAAQSCRLTVANDHYERIDKGKDCRIPYTLGFVNAYHIIEAEGYNRGRDQAVQDLLATGLYNVVRIEDWDNIEDNVSCDGSKERGDGLVTILERK